MGWDSQARCPEPRLLPELSTVFSIRLHLQGLSVLGSPAASKGGRDSLQPHSNAKCVPHQNPGTSTKPSLMYSEFLKPETHLTLKHWCGLKFLSQKWDLKKVTILRAGNPQHHSLPWLYFFSRPSPIKTRSPQTRFHVSVSPGWTGGLLFLSLRLKEDGERIIWCSWEARGELSF